MDAVDEIEEARERAVSELSDLAERRRIFQEFPTEETDPDEVRGSISEIERQERELMTDIARYDEQLAALEAGAYPVRPAEDEEPEEEEKEVEEEEEEER